MSKYLAVMITALVLIAGAGVGYVTNWFGLIPAPVDDTPTGATTIGELGTLKYSVETVSDDTPNQFAGTGYCWNQQTPTSLIESRNGKTLSGSAGTSFSPAYRGSSYECTSFSSTHFCEHDSEKMTNEGVELRSSCKNLTSNIQVHLTLYEDDVAETSNILTMGAGQTDNYNKFMVEVNVSNKAFPLKAICFGSNSSSSHLSSLEVKGWTKDAVPDSLSASADDYCFKLSSALVLNEWESNVFQNSIVFESDATGIDQEGITVTLMDQCEYISDAGKVESDYFARNTDGEADCGQTNPSTLITLV